jgi:predicted secreted hydrolase
VKKEGTEDCRTIGRVAWDKAYSGRITLFGLAFGLIALLTGLTIVRLCDSKALATACETRQLSFPGDHGKHSLFETEWWYLSGHLSSPNGKSWAYQFTAFRRSFSLMIGQSLILRAPEGYVGHLAITNIDEQEYAFVHTWGTPFLGQAGAREDGLNVWVRDWKLVDENGTFMLSAGENKISVSLAMVPAKKPVLHGRNGFSLKGQSNNQASHHYSITSLHTKGSVTWEGRSYAVEGKSWLDREFGSRMFPRDLQGWDWFGLRFEDESEIMLSLIRRSDGTAASTSYGTIVFPNGDSRNIHKGDFSISALGQWTSPRTNTLYPMGWRISVGPLNLEVDVNPLLKDHEILSRELTGLDYWEGPVSVTGSKNGELIKGEGYVELIGYAQSAGGMF